MCLCVYFASQTFCFYRFRSDGVVPTKTKITNAKPHLWKVNIAKNLREIGASYLDSRGRERSGRVIKETCPLNCIQKCSERIELEERQRIYQHYWSLKSAEKYAYISQMVERVQIKRRRVPVDQESRRKFTYNYFFHVAEPDSKELPVRLQVCKIFFMNTLDIREKKVYYYFKHLHNNAKGSRKSQ